eukprot:scaffold24645_cov101-Isochrysis_galbana.AAC.2
MPNRSPTPPPSLAAPRAFPGPPTPATGCPGTSPPPKRLGTSPPQSRVGAEAALLIAAGVPTSPAELKAEKSALHAGRADSGAAGAMPSMSRIMSSNRKAEPPPSLACCGRCASAAPPALSRSTPMLAPWDVGGGACAGVKPAADASACRTDAACVTVKTSGRRAGS